MTKKEAMEILVNGKEVYGKIGEDTLCIWPEDIKANLTMNDYELDLDIIQDMNSITIDFEMFQGHSLGEVELN